MGAAAVQSRAPCQAPPGDAEHNAPDLAGFRSRSGCPAPLPAANTKPGCELPPPHAGIRDRLEVADQIEIGCDLKAFGNREETITPTVTHACSPGKPACA